MKKNKFSLFRMALRVLSFVIAGMLVSTAMLANMDTYSWFTDEEKSVFSVNAATTADILSSIDIGYESDETPYIALQKAAGLSSSPMIYFSVEGKAAEYLKPVNPIRLTSTDQVKAALEPNISLTQFVHLVKNGPDNIKGIIKVKYLNEYIDEPMHFTLSRQYLINMFLSGIVSNPAGEPLDKILCDLITYIAPMGTWAPASPDSNGKIHLTAQQEEIVNIIVPELIAYLNKLYSENQSLYNQLSLKESQLKEKTNEANALREMVGKLNDVNAEQSAMSKRLSDRIKILEEAPTPEPSPSPTSQGTPEVTASPEATAFPSDADAQQTLK
jgi:hypothetical protein